MEYKEILTKLCSVSAPTGFEAPACAVAIELLRPYVDEVYQNPLGSVIGVKKCGKEGAKKLVLDAHLDEIGLIVIGHEDGFLRFSNLGGVDPRMLPDRELVIMTNPPRIGVVACTPPHVQKPGEQDKSMPISQLYVDVGLTQEEAEKEIPIGTPMTFVGTCQSMGEHLLWGKAMDDRACFAALLGALEQLQTTELNCDLYILGSVDEERGSSGAITAMWELAPDACIAVDVTHGDTPDGKKLNMFPLGKGPTIGKGPNCTKWMSEKLLSIGEKEEIPVQVEVMAGHSGTNGWPMQISREGVPTAVLSLPLRYMHTPLETLHIKDLENTAKLLALFVGEYGGATS
ncbi:MAG: M20/M25/M40 family metallo-hydrolase [Eubacteriales bacterium]